jgi:hypothetical protein
MNTNVTSFPQNQVFTTTNTIAATPQTVMTTTDEGQTKTSVTTPTQSQFFVNTSAAGNTNEPVMTATKTLSQNPMEATAQLLINSNPANFLQICAEQHPVSGIFAKIAQLLGFAETKTAESTNQPSALNQLREMIVSARTDFKALSQEVSQALEAKSQGRESSNSSVAQAVNQALQMFKDEINASGSLKQHLEVPQNKETLVQVATAITYQTQLISKVYLQLQHTQVFQALQNSSNAVDLHKALSNLHIAAAHFGAPQAVIDMMQQISSAVIQMITNVKQAGETFARQMGQVDLSSNPASAQVSAEAQVPVTN